MKDPIQHSLPDEAVDALAAAWLAERDGGFSPEQQAEFARWQQADPRHVVAVRRLESAWGALQGLREFRPEAQRHPDRDLLARPGRPTNVIPFRAIAATAALAASLVLAGLWWWQARPVPAAAGDPVYATTEGGYQRVSLADGSALELNAASEVRVMFTPDERQVQLRRGEAFFTVAKDKARPFIVEARGVSVRAVGTAFAVRLNDANVAVLVTEGRVKVENRGLAAADGAVPPEIGAGERFVVPMSASQPTAVAAAPAIQPVTPEEVREALAWQGPRLRFVETPLAQVVAEFNRRNRVQLELADAELGTLLVGGSFRAENVEAFVRLLESNAEIRAERPSAIRIVLHKGP